MRTGKFAFSLAGLALLLLASQAMPAQNAAAQLKGSTSAATAAGCSETETQKPAIAPYTATRKTTRVQKLANGVTITTGSTAKEAQDSSGKTYRENPPEMPVGAEGQGPAYSYFYVLDPVSRVTISWNTNSKEATVFHQPDPSEARKAALAFQAKLPAMRQSAIKPEIEQLGTKTINGVDTVGTRTTMTYPAGKAGNDQPFTVTHETWMSAELRVAVLEITDDPRTGVRTSELTDVDRNEPDPALFRVPEGYTVKDQYPSPQN